MVMQGTMRRYGSCTYLYRAKGAYAMHWAHIAALFLSDLDLRFVCDSDTNLLGVKIFRTWLRKRRVSITPHHFLFPMANFMRCIYDLSLQTSFPHDGLRQASK